MVDIHKITLSEIDLHHGTITMPKGFEIDNDQLQKDLLNSIITDSQYPFSKDWDKLNTYIRDHFGCIYDRTLINKITSGYCFKENECSMPEKDCDPVDLKNSPDYVMLYGINVENCNVRIYYNDNRRAGRSWDIPLENNKFIIFPSTQLYFINNSQKNKINSILKITYDYT